MAQIIINAGISVGGSTSGVVQLNAFNPVGLITTGSTTTASLVSFLVSTDGTSYYPLYGSDSAEVSLVVAGAARAYVLDYSNFIPWNFMKIREGTSASSVLQKTYEARFDIVTKNI
jgi:hypothetical protein